MDVLQDVGLGNLAFPVLSSEDLERVSNTILQLFDPSTSSDPDLAKRLQADLLAVQGRQEAWGLIGGLASHSDPNVRFFAAHTAQVKISRDWESLPREMHPALLQLLLHLLSDAVNPANPLSLQPGNGIVVRKIFGSLASLLLRLPFHLFPSPLTTVLSTISSSSAFGMHLPPSAPGTGFNTPTFDVPGLDAAVRIRGRLWGLEWCGICVEEIARAGISEQKRNALRRHLQEDIPAVLSVISRSMDPPPGDPGERAKEADAACKCAESWVTYGLGGDDLAALLPSLYSLLPLPSACSTIEEILSESVFKFGKGAKLLTEPLVAWIIGPPGQQVVGDATGEPSDEIIALTKLISTLVEHSSAWIVDRIQEEDVQRLLRVVLRLTGWEGVGSVEETVSELTLPIYPLLQEALMDSEIFQAPHETSPAWAVAKSFFSELVNTTKSKVRWPGDELDKEEREAFETWRRDAGEVIVGAYYVLREEMLRSLTEGAVASVQAGSTWQDIEACLHCIRYSSEAVPLGEDKSLPILFGDQVLGQLAHRPLSGRGEERLRLTVVCMIQAYEEWFKFHSDHLLPVLSYLVPSLTSTPAISRTSADALKALCDICRGKLVQHIGAFSELHGKIGDLGPEEQTKVIEAITSVIQALSPGDAIGPVESILGPILDRLGSAIAAAQLDPVSTAPLLVQTMSALTASFKGLSPAEDDIFDLTSEDDITATEEAIRSARCDQRMVVLRSRMEESIRGAVGTWNGDGEVADAISSLVKNATLASSETLIALSPLPLLSLICTACERSPSALWMSLASTLILRVNSPPSALTKKKDKTPQEVAQYEAEERERWEIVADAAGRLVAIAGPMLSGPSGMRDNPDVVEAWFKFCSAMASRFPGVLLRLPAQLVEGYMSLGVMGLAAQERFSLKTATDFFIALLASTRFPSPLEHGADALLGHFGPQILRAILLSAGSEGPRSVIPNLAELLASFVKRVPGEEMASWLTAILSEPEFPDPRATTEAKSNLKSAVLKSRTTKKMREALHEFALVARGLDNTTYGNATAI
ncbi:armadillo-type protein [Naematelia encephala]|uniref:Armadillo-type protein n=1 Tax=Naematelia encephala TaxID=71784 RepID=A0A1Y2ALU6_9TREE|nr:armadillo-type protein [Naematelia encephala]